MTMENNSSAVKEKDQAFIKNVFSDRVRIDSSPGHIGFRGVVREKISSCCTGENAR